MSVLRYIRLDVFSNQPFTGIQLAVFPDAAGINEWRCRGSQMKWLFPIRELLMAGSPTIGTVFALAIPAFDPRRCSDGSAEGGGFANWTQMDPSFGNGKTGKSANSMTGLK